MTAVLRGLCAVLVSVVIAGCGKKGPPLAPLVILPGPVTDVSAKRIGDRAVVRFGLPEKNTDNSTPADVARVDIYALSAPDAADAPEAGVVARDGTRVGSIELPKPGAGAAKNQDSKDKDTAAQEPPAGPRTFTEALTADAMKMWSPPKRAARASGSTAGASGGSSAATGSTRPATGEEEEEEKPVAGVPAAAGAAAEKSEAAETTPEPVRLYAIVPVSAKGRRGPAMLASVPLAPAPAPLTRPIATYTDKAVSVTWVADQAAAGYNVYEAPADASGAAAPSVAPLNESPVREATFDDPRIEFGKTRCYRVTAVREITPQLRVESAMSDAACVTPVDTFAPAAPTGVAAVAGPGVMSLIWDAANAPDLAGYVVLRGEAPGDTLQALTPEPIKETTFRDTRVTPGTRYVYAVVAVDTAKNMSAQSARVEETAR